MSVGRAVYSWNSALPRRDVGSALDGLPELRYHERPDQGGCLGAEQPLGQGDEQHLRLGQDVGHREGRLRLTDDVPDAPSQQ